MAVKRTWGVLTREFPVRLLECAASGCLLDSASTILPGTTGSLHFSVGHRTFEEHVQVVRCQRIAGAGTFHVGVRILWTTAPDERSLRMAIGSAVTFMPDAPSRRAGK